jgi:hypothetical protein
LKEFFSATGHRNFRSCHCRRCAACRNDRAGRSGEWPVEWPAGLMSITRRASGRLMWLGSLGLLGVSCGGDCVVGPCPLPIAVTVTVMDAARGGALSGAFVLDSVGTNVNNFPCGGDGSCVVTGAAGAYKLMIGAAGFQTVQRTVVVHGTDAKCACQTADTVQLNAARAGATS